jgi:hypothetical protein
MILFFQQDTLKKLEGFLMKNATLFEKKINLNRSSVRLLPMSCY